MLNAVRLFVAFCFVVLSYPASFAQSVPVEDHEWPSYSRDQMGTRYSPLEQITRENVDQLERAWVHRTGDIAEGGAHYFECTPLMVDNTLYVITTFSRLQAIDPTTGELKWTFDPDPPLQHRETGAGGLASRGVSYWQSTGEDQPSKARIFLPVRDGRLYSIDPETGTPDPEFGKNGFINLRDNLEGEGRYLFISSPPAIYEDLVIQGFGVNDSWQKNPRVPIRAFSALTGEEVWAFDTIPQEEGFARDTWEGDSWKNRGGGNVWSIMTVDPERGLLFLPVSTPNWDFYGGDRPGKNLFTDAVVALNAKTGEYVWHYQTVHHDLWDYDLAAQPNLVEVTVDGETIPALAQGGKTGFVYLLNRETGEPIFPIPEMPVPTDGVTGEQPWPTQPWPNKPPNLVRTHLTEDNLNTVTPEAAQWAKETFEGLRSDGIFTPPSKEGSIVYPGLHGGMNWSGAAVTPDGMLFTNTTELAFLIQLDELEDVDDAPFPHRIGASIWLKSPEGGYPLNNPPWGELVKVDLNKGEILWKKPLGEFEALSAQGIPPTGQENFGGATLTAGGLVFIASTMDGKIRAFDQDNGEILWEHQMEAAGYAAPITYMAQDGKQYVVICAGGGAKPGTKHGDYVIGFALGD